VTDYDVYLPAIQAGDASAFGRWVAGSELRVRASLVSFATRLDVEAVLQETLLRVWQVAPRVEADGRPNSLLRFAIRVARNAAISELRRNRSAAGVPEEREQATDPPEPDPLLRRIIVGCREALPNKPALALTQRLQAGGGEPDKVLAAQVGMRTNTFLQNITRARKLLAECLQRRGVTLQAVMP